MADLIYEFNFYFKKNSYLCRHIIYQKQNRNDKNNLPGWFRS